MTSKHPKTQAWLRDSLMEQISACLQLLEAVLIFFPGFDLIWLAFAVSMLNCVKQMKGHVRFGKLLADCCASSERFVMLAFQNALLTDPFYKLVYRPILQQWLEEMLSSTARSTVMHSHIFSGWSTLRWMAVVMGLMAYPTSRLSRY